MNGPDPLKRLPNGCFHFLVVVTFVFGSPVIEEIEGGGHFRAQGASKSVRITATSLAEAASLLESFLAARVDDDPTLQNQAYPEDFEFEVCDPNTICEEYQEPGVVSESSWFYFDDTDDGKASQERLV